jgi:hypothetical protein
MNKLSALCLTGILLAGCSSGDRSRPSGQTAPATTAAAGSGSTASTPSATPPATPAAPTTPVAPPTSAPRPTYANVVNVANEADLQQAVRQLASDTSIVIAPGVYRLTNTLNVTGGISDVELRGASGNRDDVVLEGPGMSNASFGNVPHGVMGSDVVRLRIADLTIRGVYYHPITFQPQSGCQAPTVSGCRLVDAGEQFIKSNSAPNGGVNDGVVEDTIMEYTTTARSDYTNGVDVHTGRGWVIRRCEFRNIRAPQGGGLAGPAVLMWNRCADTICEDNLFVDCARGIAFGLDAARSDDHVGGVIRNNVIYRAPGVSGDVGISLFNSAGTKVLHNTVLLSGTYPNACEYRFAATVGVEISANLCDAAITARDGASGAVQNNSSAASPADFVNVAALDFHLVAGSSAVDAAPGTPDCVVDREGDSRPLGSGPDLGADELRP